MPPAPDTGASVVIKNVDVPVAPVPPTPVSFISNAIDSLPTAPVPDTPVSFISNSRDSEPMAPVPDVPVTAKSSLSDTIAVPTLAAPDTPDTLNIRSWCIST